MDAEEEMGAVGAQLDELSERLADLALEQLRVATRPGDPGRDGAEALERRLTRARRAVAKAAAILAGPPEAFPGD